jgi:hypothetical protein
MQFAYKWVSVVNVQEEAFQLCHKAHYGTLCLDHPPPQHFNQPIFVALYRSQ